MAGVRTKWYVVNIKARTNQSAQHYYDAMVRLKEDDPLIRINGEKYISLMRLADSTIVNSNTELPEWIAIKLMSFVLVDPNGFYDKRERQPVTIEWNADWVSNKKEEEVLFCLSNHTLAVKKSSKITLNHIVKYFKEALQAIEPDTFDVDIIANREVIDRIRNAHTLLRLEANISFSNPGHASEFPGLFDTKLNEANPVSFTATLIGNENNPIGKAPNGLVDALVGAADRDGTVKAKIKETDAGETISINTGEHPRIVEVEGERGSNLVSVWNAIRSLFS